MLQEMIKGFIFANSRRIGALRWWKRGHLGGQPVKQSRRSTGTPLNIRPVAS